MMPRSNFNTAATTALVLSDGELFSRYFETGARVLARTGTIWVTQSGDDRDVLLGAGESLVMEPGSEAVLSAVDGAARIEVEAFSPPHATAWTERVLSALHLTPHSDGLGTG